MQERPQRAPQRAAHRFHCRWKVLRRRVKPVFINMECSNRKYTQFEVHGDDFNCFKTKHHNVAKRVSLCQQKRNRKKEMNIVTRTVVPTGQLFSIVLSYFVQSTHAKGNLVVLVPYQQLHHVQKDNIEVDHVVFFIHDLSVPVLTFTKKQVPQKPFQKIQKFLRFTNF